jgi:hypothetical protein
MASLAFIRTLTADNFTCHRTRPFEREQFYWNVIVPKQVKYYFKYRRATFSNVAP